MQYWQKNAAPALTEKVTECYLNKRIDKHNNKFKPSIGS